MHPIIGKINAVMRGRTSRVSDFQGGEGDREIRERVGKERAG